MNNEFPSLYLLWVLVMAGCSSAPLKQDGLDEMEQVLVEGAQQSIQHNTVPDGVSSALLPPIEFTVPSVEPRRQEERFDITVKDISAEQFFMSLVDGTPYNMVVHPEVQGEISLNLKAVTLTEVMEALRDVYGYEFVRTHQGFRVLPNRLQARIYQIDYLNVQRSGTSSTFVSSGTLQDSSGGSELSSAGLGVGNFGGDSGGVVGTQIKTTQPETSFWTELQTAIKTIVGEKEGRNIVVNPQSGIIVVRAVPAELREIEAFLEATQLIAKRQVILEAKILEVELSEGHQTGVNWAALLGDFTAATTGGGRSLLNGGGLSDIAGQTGVLNPKPNLFQPIEGSLASAFGGVFSLALSSNNFSAFIELLQSQGNVQVLSSPRISTMNNQKAVIKVGTDEFFVTNVSTTTVTGTATTSTPNIELTPFFSGIALDVTPQISARNEVTLHVHPSVTRVVDQQKTITVGSQVQSIPLAKSTVRESDSIVRAKSGQIIVIGGLMQDQNDGKEAKLPGIGDIPGLGLAFKQKRRSSLKSELVILLRPLVVNGGRQWAAAIEGSKNTVRSLKEQLDKRITTW